MSYRKSCRHYRIDILNRVQSLDKEEFDLGFEGLVTGAVAATIYREPRLTHDIAGTFPRRNRSLNLIMKN
jgi:hypothetical protein